MTGRKAYELYTSEMGKISTYQRESSQLPESLIAWDDLFWAERNAWQRIAKRIKGTRVTAR